MLLSLFFLRFNSSRMNRYLRQLPIQFYNVVHLLIVTLNTQRKQSIFYFKKHKCTTILSFYFLYQTFYYI